MSVDLRPHNQEVYERIVENFRESDKTSVIHPTGTGKSYLALKLLEDNPDKRVVYIAPSISILYNLRKNMQETGLGDIGLPRLRRVTYQTLASQAKKFKNNDEEQAQIDDIKADIIVLDEFHHCGAPEWGAGVERLMKNNPNAKILGLSATPIRYSDDLRDMSDELFDGNVTSEMTLEEAIERGI